MCTQLTCTTIKCVSTCSFMIVCCIPVFLFSNPLPASQLQLLWMLKSPRDSVIHRWVFQSKIGKQIKLAAEQPIKKGHHLTPTSPPGWSQDCEVERRRFRVPNVKWASKSRATNAKSLQLPAKPA